MKYFFPFILLFLCSCALFLSPNEIRIRNCYKFIDAAQNKDYSKCKTLLHFDPKYKTEKMFEYDIDEISSYWTSNNLPQQNALLFKVNKDQKFTTIRFPINRYYSAHAKDTCKGYLEFSFDDYHWSNHIGNYFRNTICGNESK